MTSGFSIYLSALSAYSGILLLHRIRRLGCLDRSRFPCLEAACLERGIFCLRSSRAVPRIYCTRPLQVSVWKSEPLQSQDFTCESQSDLGIGVVSLRAM